MRNPLSSRFMFAVAIDLALILASFFVLQSFFGFGLLDTYFPVAMTYLLLHVILEYFGIG